MGVQWVDEKGIRILYSDFRQCADETAMIDLFNKAAEIVLAEPEPCLTMNNFDGLDLSLQFLRLLRKSGSNYSHKVLGKAVLGVTGAKRTYINTYSVLTGIDARAFTTEAEALSYLVSLKKKSAAK